MSPPSRRGLASFVLSHLAVTNIDEALARRSAGLLQAVHDSKATARPSVVDGLVAAESERENVHLVFDGDRADFEALASASGRIDLVELRDLT